MICIYHCLTRYTIELMQTKSIVHAANTYDMTSHQTFMWYFLIILNVAMMTHQHKFDTEWDSELQKRNPAYKCGIKNKNKDYELSGSSARIINGKPTTSKTHPWVAQIFLTVPDPTIPDAKAFLISESSGTIISNTAIISCLHCVCAEIGSALTKYVQDFKYVNLPEFLIGLPKDIHNCVGSIRDGKYPPNQNRKENVINYHIASDPLPTGQAEWFQKIGTHRDNIKAFIYQYDPEWNFKNARLKQASKELYGNEALYLKNGDLSIIIDVNGLKLAPRISTPVCLPVPNSFQGDPIYRRVNVVVAARGTNYMEFETTYRKKKYSTCYTNEGLVPDNKKKKPPNEHLFLPCKDYMRLPNGSPNHDVCIKMEKAYLNGDKRDQTEFQSISTDSEIEFLSGGWGYNIKTEPDGKCNEYWKKAKAWGAPGVTNTERRHDIEDDIDILIVLDSDKSTENWMKESKDWLDNGIGTGTRCYNFKKLAKNGICKTESTRYTWGFCSRSCAIGSHSTTRDIERNMIRLEEGNFWYYDDTDHNKLTGYGIGIHGDKSHLGKGLLLYSNCNL